VGGGRDDKGAGDFKKRSGPGFCNAFVWGTRRRGQKGEERRGRRKKRGAGREGEGTSYSVEVFSFKYLELGGGRGKKNQEKKVTGSLYLQ